ncbi:MAG TPA: choice-of-anchor B family protein [Gemmatimonadales bacterium]|jgi:choice-of-anchor B domain-containing protein
MRHARLSFPLAAAAVAALLVLRSGRAVAASSPDPSPDSLGVIGFGGSALVLGDQVLIGRPGVLVGFPMPPTHAGTVHVFRREGGGWVEGEMLHAKDGTLGDGFGSALAAEKNLLLVGAPGAPGGGAVYVFERGSDGRWSERARVTAKGGAEGDRLGAAVAVRAGVLLAGAPGRDEERGSVLVFARGRTAGEWTLRGTIQPGATAAGDWFGAAVAFDGQRALVGAPGGTAGPLDSTRLRPGQAFVFRSAGGKWSEETRLTPPTPAGNGAMGMAVLLEGTEALIGAPRTDSLAGTVVRFTRQGTTWTQAGTIAPDSAVRPAGFGSSLAWDGSDLLVGAPLVGMNAGAVHVFRRGSSGWRQKQLLVTPPAGFATRLGATLAARGGLAIAGAPLADFFEGYGLLYQRDAAGGSWREVTTVTDTISSVLPAVAGGEVKCQSGKARGFDCRDADLVSFLPKSAIGAKRGTLLNDLWGWTDSTSGREFAIVGRTDGTSFVEVTDPANPKYLGDLPLHAGARPNIWRDIKVYRNHAFIVADGAGPHGMQVFDLTQLLGVTTPQTFRETAHYDQIASAHNIVINEATGFAYPVGNSMGGTTCGGALHMVDIREPAKPKFAGCFADPSLGLQRTGYTHDAQCVVYHGPDARYHGREICFTASEIALGIADVTDKASPKAIGTAAYPNVAYAHQGWLTDDQRYFFLDDEGDELAGTAPRTRTLVFDLTDLEDPVVAKEFYGNTAASDHNLYVKGRYMYQSNYVAGLRVVDVSDPTNPVEVGYFDTVPVGENLPGFSGSWSNYPYFKSGVVAATSMREGLFLVRYQPSTVLP